MMTLLALIAAVFAIKAISAGLEIRRTELAAERARGFKPYVVEWNRLPTDWGFR